jgi:hypothetical protein
VVDNQTKTSTSGRLQLRLDGNMAELSTREAFVVVYAEKEEQKE